MQQLRADDGTFDEALERLHRTGPEFDGWLSNHGPMAVESLARHGRDAAVSPWLDRYLRRLEAAPAPGAPVGEDWRAALGDPARLGSWIERMRRDLREDVWEGVLARWWPRLTPGIAAGATHGVIRTGHAVRALRDDVTDPRLEELAQALGYWAARWQEVPSVHLQGALTAEDLVASVPRVARQEGGIRDRLAQLADTEGWQQHVDRLSPVTTDAVRAATDSLVDAVVLGYAQMAHGEPTMLVHAATAPNAVSRVLPSIPPTLWRESYDHAWSASAAVLAAYRPREDVRRTAETLDPDRAWELAVRHGSEHVIKLADTALDVYARTGDPAALAAVSTAAALDA